MRIGIILHPYGEKEPAGLARAILDLTRAMILSSPGDEFTIFAKGDAPARPDFPGSNWSFHPLGRGFFWRERIRARAPGADVYLFNTPVLPLFRRPRKSVLIALDFAYLAAPVPGMAGRVRTLLLRLYHAFSLSRADAVIAISEATKKDAVRFFRIPEDKIRVVRLGFHPVCSLPEARVDAPEKFFLFVGALKERKNVHGIIAAFARFAKSRPEYHLLLAGAAGGEYGVRMRRISAESGVGQRIKFLGHVSDATLSYLYRRAAALMYPSIIEGFGFPVLEAMDCGIPVITSHVSSLAEIGGEAALLVDPQSPEAIAAGMARIVDEPGLRETLIRKGNAWKDKFSWNKAGKEMAERLREIILRV